MAEPFDRYPRDWSEPTSLKEAPEPLRIALIGAGAVGTAVAELLRRRGHHIAGVSSRTDASARRAARQLSSSTFDHTRGAPEADLLLLGVPDARLTEIAALVAPHVTEGAVVAHFAGALGLEPLEAVAKRGRPCALHPLAACPSLDAALRRLPGASWGVTSSPTLEAWADAFVSHELGGLPVTVPGPSRPLWHAAAVMTANGVTGLLVVAEAMLAGAGVRPGASALGRLAEGAAANAGELGSAAAALTGPVVRNEPDTVAQHLRALAEAAALEDAPAVRDGYVHALGVIVEAARLAGRLEEDLPARLTAMLAGRPG